MRWVLALATCGWALVRMTWTERPSALVSSFCRRLLVRLRVRVVVTRPLPIGAPLWVANHLSWLDPLVLLALRPAGVLAKAEVADYPIVGWGVRRAGLHFVQRDEPRSRAAALVAMAAALRKGQAFLVFPEGTTTRGPGIAPLQWGSLRLAWRMDIAVLPLRIESPDDHYPWTGDERLVPHLRGLSRKSATHVRVHPGCVLHPRDFANETAFLEAVRRHMADPYLPVEVPV